MRWTCYRVVIKKPVQKELKWSDIPSKKPKKEKKLLTHKTSVTKKKTDELTSKHERPDSIRYKPSGFEQSEKVDPESLYALQGSFGADSRADTLLADETELNDSLGVFDGSLRDYEMLRKILSVY